MDTQPEPTENSTNGSPADTPAGNLLAAEQSPYLLQHADNPVHWLPWGEDAFELAKREDKPVFLSIGYSTCHWCHVMAHESFENDEVARILNDHFVSIKVDREERPDIDQVYMTVCQMMTGSGGWPLTIVMTPDKRPFFAATYIPRTARYGRTGMTELLPQLADIWRHRRQDALSAAEEVVKALSGDSRKSTGVGNSKDTPPGTSLVHSAAPGTVETELLLHRGYRDLAARFDLQHGGFGDAPKFPSPHNLLFLMRYGRRFMEADGETDGENSALQMVETTLQAMRRGGMYDHLGFGFHRYATDSHWLVPHFEKMLYDQAMLAMAYTEAYQVTGKDEYRMTAAEILTYVLRDLRDATGGFHSAEDADSEGEEGKFYVWTEEEVRRGLSHEFDHREIQDFIEAYNIGSDGNFRDEATGARTGANILHLTAALNEAGETTADRLDVARLCLLTAREHRVRPHKDDKILADWNGLMIAAFARAARVFGHEKDVEHLPDYSVSAASAADLVLSRMRDDEGRLLHRYRGGEAAIPGTLDDHAFMILGLIELYEATFEARWLREAVALASDMLRNFSASDGGFYLTPSHAEELLVRPRELYDGAIPSGNGVAMEVLLRLGRLTGDPTYEEAAHAALAAFATQVARMPSAYAQTLMALELATGQGHEVVIVGTPGADDTERMLSALRGAQAAGTSSGAGIVVLFKSVGTSESGVEANELTDVALFTREMEMVDGKATAYVCTDHSCALPTTDVTKMLVLLDAT